MILPWKNNYFMLYKRGAGGGGGGSHKLFFIQTANWAMVLIIILLTPLDIICFAYHKKT